MPARRDSCLWTTRPRRFSAVGSRGGVPDRRGAPQAQCPSVTPPGSPPRPSTHIGQSRSSKTSLLETSCRQGERSRNDLPDTSLRRAISGRLRPSPREHRAPEPTKLPTWQVRPTGALPVVSTPAAPAIRRRKLLRVAAQRSIFGSPIACSADVWSIFFFQLASAAAAPAIFFSPIDSRADARSIFFSPIDRFSDARSIGDLHSRSRGRSGRFLDVSGVSEPSASSTATRPVRSAGHAAVIIAGGRLSGQGLLVARGTSAGGWRGPRAPSWTLDSCISGQGSYWRIASSQFDENDKLEPPWNRGRPDPRREDDS